MGNNTPHIVILSGVRRSARSRRTCFLLSEPRHLIPSARRSRDDSKWFMTNVMPISGHWLPRLLCTTLSAQGETMKRLGLLALMCVVAICAGAQEKPRVFVQGKGSQDVNTDGAAGGDHHWAAWGSRSTIDSHDESMEVTKDLQKNCSSVVVTLNQSTADYTILLNRESKKNRGLLRSNSQVEVANRAGDILGTNATHTVDNAAKDACQLITADWQTHGRISVAPASASLPAAAPVSPAVTPNGAVSATASATQPDPATAAKQHDACLELAKDNPSISCK